MQLRTERMAIATPLWTVTVTKLIIAASCVLAAYVLYSEASWCLDCRGFASSNSQLYLSNLCEPRPTFDSEYRDQILSPVKIRGGVGKIDE